MTRLKMAETCCQGKNANEDRHCCVCWNMKRSVLFQLNNTTGCPVQKLYNLHSYNKSQPDALFLKFILAKNCTYFGQSDCPSSGGLDTVNTAIGICHTGYVDCLLARSVPS